LDEIHLNRGKLPFAAENVAGKKIGFRTVEGGLAAGFEVSHAAGIQCRAQGGFGFCPFLFVLDELAALAAQRKADAVIGELVATQE
jgi:hypothetical protein